MTTAVDTTTGAPRPGSRAARMAQPLAWDAIRQLAEDHGICTRMITLEQIDEVTGQRERIEKPCGATRAAVCKPCAERARLLRMVQCREGWHRDDEPLQPAAPDEWQVSLLEWRADLEFQAAKAMTLGDFFKAQECEVLIEAVEVLIAKTGMRGRVSTPTGGGHEQPRRKRSTRRRQDVPDLPRMKVSARTIGRVYKGTGGAVFRPSMFLTLTLPSYGPVRADGSPVNPDRYDYRRAAWDAVHFPALLDRFWQNFRRAVGWNVQYFGAIEPQRRLAPHAHFAARGSFPHAIFNKVVEATYFQVWWPSTSTVVYPETGPQPVWDEAANKGKGGYVDPTTGTPLPTWEQAMDALDDELDANPDRQPEHVVRFGTQKDSKGVVANTPQAEKLVGYLAKYLTKNVAECHPLETDSAARHHQRLWEELRFTPCSPGCANWLRYGVQPKQSKTAKKLRTTLQAGHCKGNVHRPATLAIGGRRVLVSRDWSAKTLSDHKWDQFAFVRQLLAEGIGHTTNTGGEDQGQGQGDNHGQGQGQGQGQGGSGGRNGSATPPARRLRWERVNPKGDPARRLLRAIGTRMRQKAALRAAQLRSATSPPPPTTDGSATDDEEGGRPR